MIQRLFKLKKYIPFLCTKTIFDIDYEELYKNGRRIILIDLDNTIIPYDKSEPDEMISNLFTKIKSIGFDVVIMSNNHKNRVSHFANLVNTKFVFSTRKPLKFGYKKALKLTSFESKKEVIAIGDQMMTDVLGASRNKIDCILVKPLKKKSEKWYTKLNRLMEKDVLKRIKKYYSKTYVDLIEIGVVND